MVVDKKTSDALIEVNNACLSVQDRQSLGSQKVLFENLSFSVKPSEFMAIVGPNGAGKSTLLRVLLGSQKLDSGVGLRQGKPIHSGAKNVGFIPQQRLFSANTPLRGRDFIALGVDGTDYGFTLGKKRKRRHQRVEQLVDQIDGSSFVNGALGKLSGGEQQRIRIVQALANKPDIIFCDEPLLSLDSLYQKKMSDLIAEQTKRQAGVIFVTHEIEPIRDYVDTVLYLHGDGSGTYTLGSVERILSQYESTMINHHDETI